MVTRRAGRARRRTRVARLTAVAVAAVASACGSSDPTSAYVDIRADEFVANLAERDGFTVEQGRCLWDELVSDHSNLSLRRVSESGPSDEHAPEPTAWSRAVLGCVLRDELLDQPPPSGPIPTAPAPGVAP